MREIEETIGRKFCLLLTALAFAVLFSAQATALNGHVIESGPSEIDTLLFDTDTDPDTTASYLDSTSEYDDAGLMVCPDSGTADDEYVGLTYAMNQDNNVQRVLVSYESGNSNLPLADTAVSFNGNTCKRTGFGSVFVTSASEFPGKNPSVSIAAFPARTYLLTSDSATGGTVGYDEIDPNDGNSDEMGGSYSCSTSYTYSSNDVDFSLNSIIVEQTGGGTHTFGPNDGLGVSSDRPILFGVCNDQKGQNCPSIMQKQTAYSDVTNDFDQPRSQVNDQVTYTRYGVTNGIQCDTLNIGADVTVSSISVEKDPIFFSQTQTVNFTIQNTGNVPVTSTFRVNLSVKGPQGGPNQSVVRSEFFTYTQDLAQNGGTLQDSFTWTAKHHSGTYDVEIEADVQDDLNELQENDNTDTQSFELKPITRPEIKLNGNETMTIEKVGVPYNFSLSLENSDNDTLRNATTDIIEENGISAFAPSQEINRTVNSNGGTRTSGLNVTNKVSFKTDYQGTASLTLVPTGNILLAEKYSYLDPEDFIGNYTVRLEGRQYDGQKFRFVENDTVKNATFFKVKDPGNYSRTSSAGLPNVDSHVKIVMDTVYTIFSNFWGMIT